MDLACDSLPCDLCFSLSPSSGPNSQVSQGGGRLATLATERGRRGAAKSLAHASQPTRKHIADIADKPAEVVLQSPLESGARAVLGHVTSFLGYHLDIFRSGSRASSAVAFLR